VNGKRLRAAKTALPKSEGKKLQWFCCAWRKQRCLEVMYIFVDLKLPQY